MKSLGHKNLSQDFLSHIKKYLQTFGLAYKSSPQVFPSRELLNCKFNIYVKIVSNCCDEKLVAILDEKLVAGLCFYIIIYFLMLRNAKYKNLLFLFKILANHLSIISLSQITVLSDYLICSFFFFFFCLPDMINLLSWQRIFFRILPQQRALVLIFE